MSTPQTFARIFDSEAHGQILAHVSFDANQCPMIALAFDPVVPGMTLINEAIVFTPTVQGVADARTHLAALEQRQLEEWATRVKADIATQMAEAIATPTEEPAPPLTVIEGGKADDAGETPDEGAATES